MTSPFVAEIDLALKERMMRDLKDKGFTLSQPAHTAFQAKGKGVSCTLYLSGKLVVQGKEMKPFIEFYLEPEILGKLSFSYPNIKQDPRIGIDESGKGDFFGPLCIAGVYAGPGDVQKLMEMGVKDSKRMQDSVIVKLAGKIRSICATEVIKIGPAKYNALYSQFQNLNRLLAWGHATAIEALVQSSGCNDVIIDQFASEAVVENALKRKNVEVSLTQRHRGEADPVVAAASIMARAAFVHEMAQLEKRFGLRLPKGASAVKGPARAFIDAHGRESLPQVAKMHFKTAAEL